VRNSNQKRLRSADRFFFLGLQGAGEQPEENYIYFPPPLFVVSLSVT